MMVTTTIQTLQMMSCVAAFIWIQVVRCGFDYFTVPKPSTAATAREFPTGVSHTVELEHEQYSHGASSSANPFLVGLHHAHHAESTPPPTLDLFPRQSEKLTLNLPRFRLDSWSPPPIEAEKPNLNPKLSPSPEKNAANTFGVGSEEREQFRRQQLRENVPFFEPQEKRKTIDLPFKSLGISPGTSVDYHGESTPLPIFNFFPLQPEKMALNPPPFGFHSWLPLLAGAEGSYLNRIIVSPSSEERALKTFSSNSQGRGTDRSKRIGEYLACSEPPKRRKTLDVPSKTLETSSGASESDRRPESRRVTPSANREVPVEIQLPENYSKSRGSQLNGFHHSSIPTTFQKAIGEPRFEKGQSIVGDLQIERAGKTSDRNDELTREQTGENIATPSARQQSEHGSENINLEDPTSKKDLAFQYYSHQTWFDAPHPLCPKAALLSMILAEYLLSKVPNKQTSDMLEMMHQSHKILLPFIYQLNQKSFLRQRWARISQLWENFWGCYGQSLGNNPNEVLRRFVWISDYIYEITLPNLYQSLIGDSKSRAASFQSAQARMVKDISISNHRFYKLNRKTYVTGSEEILKVYLTEPPSINFKKLDAQSSVMLHKFVLETISRNAGLITSCLDINLGEISRKELVNLFDVKSAILNTGFNEIAEEFKSVQIIKRIFPEGNHGKILEIFRKKSEVIGRLTPAPFKASMDPNGLLQYFNYWIKGQRQPFLPQKIKEIFARYQVT